MTGWRKCWPRRWQVVVEAGGGAGIAQEEDSITLTSSMGVVGVRRRCHNEGGVLRQEEERGAKCHSRQTVFQMECVPQVTTRFEAIPNIYATEAKEAILLDPLFSTKIAWRSCVLSHLLSCVSTISC